MAGERRHKGLGLLVAAIEGFQQVGHLLQIGGAPAQRLEEGLALIGADPWVVQVYGEDALVFLRIFPLEANEEGLLAHHRGDVAGAPAFVCKEEVLALLEAEERHRAEAALAILLQEDGVVGLQAAELEGEGQGAHDGVAKFG